MDADNEKTTKPRPRGLRFSLRTLLIVVTVLSIPLGWIGRQLLQVRRERATITWVKEMDGDVSFHHEFEADPRSWWEKTTDKWFGERVWIVKFSNTQVKDLSPLAELKSLEVLWLHHTRASDLSPLADVKKLKSLSLSRSLVSDLSPLAELKNLETLNLYGTQVSDEIVSDEQVQELRQALPNCKIYQ